MLVPSVPPVNTGFHAIWPGLQPTDDSFVFQNVVDDDQPVGKWAYSTWYGPYDAASVFFSMNTVEVSPKLMDKTEAITMITPRFQVCLIFSMFSKIKTDS